MCIDQVPNNIVLVNFSCHAMMMAISEDGNDDDHKDNNQCECEDGRKYEQRVEDHMRCKCELREYMTVDGDNTDNVSQVRKS